MDPETELFGPYRAVLRALMPEADFALERPRDAGFDARLTLRGPQAVVRYAVEEKRHLQQQDVRLVLEQLKRRQLDLRDPTGELRLLLLTPYLRPQQAAVLEEADIDYVDLAGNAHLRGPQFLVHVEGRRPPKEPAKRPGRINKGWVKTVLALLVRPDNLNAPYRVIAQDANIALGTITACMNDLIGRGLLRERDGKRQLLDRQHLLALWVQAYVDVLRPTLEERRFQVRAATKPEIWERLKHVLEKHDIRWTLTGADAAEMRTHFFHAEETEIYADVRAFGDRDLQKALVAQPAMKTGNLLVIAPPAPVAVVGAPHEGVPAAAEVLAYAELRYRGTAQALEAAEMLLPQVVG